MADSMDIYVSFDGVQRGQLTGYVTILLDDISTHVDIDLTDHPEDICYKIVREAVELRTAHANIQAFCDGTFFTQLNQALTDKKLPPLAHSKVFEDGAIKWRQS